jgi:hypothetical protein
VWPPVVPFTQCSSASSVQASDLEARSPFEERLNQALDVGPVDGFAAEGLEDRAQYLLE